MNNFSNLKETVFYSDGTLRDIYVLNTNIQDWETLYAYIVKNYPAKFTIDGEAVIPLPEIVHEVFTLRENKTPCLCFLVGDMDVCTHFFHETEFEVDIDPSQVKKQEDVDKLLDFISRIGILIKKNVIVTGESAQSELLLTYDYLKKDFLSSK